MNEKEFLCYYLVKNAKVGDSPLNLISASAAKTFALYGDIPKLGVSSSSDDKCLSINEKLIPFLTISFQG